MVHKRKQASTHVCLSILLVCQSCLAAGVLRRLLLEPGAVFRADKPDETRWDDPPDLYKDRQRSRVVSVPLCDLCGRTLVIHCLSDARCQAENIVQHKPDETVCTYFLDRHGGELAPRIKLYPLALADAGVHWGDAPAAEPRADPRAALVRSDSPTRRYSFNILVRLCPSDDRHSWPARLSCRALKL